MSRVEVGSEENQALVDQGIRGRDAKAADGCDEALLSNLCAGTLAQAAAGTLQQFCEKVVRPAMRRCSRLQRPLYAGRCPPLGCEHGPKRTGNMCVCLWASTCVRVEAAALQQIELRAGLGFNCSGIDPTGNHPPQEGAHCRLKAPR